MDDVFPPVGELIPHRDAMQLITDIVSDTETELTARIIIPTDHPFLVADKGVPTYVALEMMAQAICAKDGLDQRRTGNPPAIGFLLGCQRFRTYRDWLGVGEEFTTRVTCRLDADELGSFDCELRGANDEVVAKGAISVFRPKDVEGFLKESELHV